MSVTLVMSGQQKGLELFKQANASFNSGEGGGQVR
jgi:hypothetical protein